jgi:intein-encoded DNA endonuclease-like protein
MKYPYISEDKCMNCDGDIKIKRSRDKTNKFCGSACVGKFYNYKEPVFVKCKQCNMEFKKTCKTQNIYCSNKCTGKAKEKFQYRNCNRCGKNFRLINIAYEKRGAGKYCSRDCGTRTYEFDDTYFENIDNESKAYWLGFIAADGNVYKNELRIHISSKDKMHIIKFKNDIKSNNIINNGQNDTISFNIYSKKIVKQLTKYNIVPQKTNTFSIKNIPSKFIRHFIRGYFDGDGCIYVKNKQNCWSIFSNSSKFIKQIISIINKAINDELLVYSQNKGWSIRLSRKLSIEKIYHYLYDDSSICLERKLNKFKIIFPN